MARGIKADEMNRNARKWKNAAEEAVADGGSSDQNIRAWHSSRQSDAGWIRLCCEPIDCQVYVLVTF